MACFAIFGRSLPMRIAVALWPYGASRCRPGKRAAAGRNHPRRYRFRGIELLKSRLAGLAAAIKIRDARIIITSNHTPSPALADGDRSDVTSCADAPYFTVAEVRELVEQPAAPDATLIEGWANLIHVSTSGGHPLLVTAKIANLRARGWPDQASARGPGRSGERRGQGDKD